MQENKWSSVDEVFEHWTSQKNADLESEHMTSYKKMNSTYE
jgi:hypothetical protein